jgi:hypothetical protein
VEKINFLVIIRIEQKCWIRIRIKSIRIRNPGHTFRNWYRYTYVSSCSVLFAFSMQFSDYFVEKPDYFRSKWTRAASCPWSADSPPHPLKTWRMPVWMFIQVEEQFFNTGIFKLAWQRDPQNFAELKYSYRLKSYFLFWNSLPAQKDFFEMWSSFLKYGFESSKNFPMLSDSHP